MISDLSPALLGAWRRLRDHLAATAAAVNDGVGCAGDAPDAAVAADLGVCLLLRARKARRHNSPAEDASLLLAATTVAMKAHFDDFYVNKYMARIGGLEAPRELAELEAHLFVTLLGGRAQVSAEELRAAQSGLRVASKRRNRRPRARASFPQGRAQRDTTTPATVRRRSSDDRERAPPTVRTLRGVDPSFASAAPSATPFDRAAARAKGAAIVAAMNRKRPERRAPTPHGDQGFAHRHNQHHHNHRRHPTWVAQPTQAPPVVHHQRWPEPTVWVRVNPGTHMPA